MAQRKEKGEVYRNDGIVCLKALLHTQYLLTLYTHTLVGSFPIISLAMYNGKKET